MQKGKRVRPNVSAMSDLVQYQVVPHGRRPLRLPTFPQIERTSVLSFMDNANVGTPADSAPGQGSVDLLLVRSPVYPLWQSRQPVVGSYSHYTLFSPTADTNFPKTVGATLDADDYVNFSRLTDIGGNLTWSSTPIYGVDNEERLWFWVPAGFKFCVQYSLQTLMATGSWKQLVYFTNKFIPDEVVTEQVVVYTPGSSTITFLCSYDAPGSYGAWARVGRLLCSADGSVNTSMGIVYVGFTTGTNLTNPTSGTTRLTWYPVSSPPEHSTVPYIYEQARANAVALLVQNATAVFYKQGVVTAVRKPVDEFSLLDTKIGDLRQAVSGIAASERYFGLLEKGFYTYAPPDETTVKFQCYSYEDAAGVSRPVLRLGGFGYVTAIAMTDLEQAGASQLALTLDTHLEFRNTTQLFDIGICSVTLEDWHKAQIAMAKLGYFFENPTHLAVIAKLARAAAAKLWPIVRPYAQAAGAKLLSTASGAIMTRMGVGTQNVPGTNIPTQKRRKPPQKVKTRKPRPKK